MYYVPWAKRERVERFLNCGLVLLEPAFGPECLDVFAPDILVPVDCVRGDAQYSTFWEKASANREPTLGRESRKTNARRRVDPQRLVYDSLEIGQTLDLLVRRNGVVLGTQGIIELLLKGSLYLRVVGKMVRNSTR